MFTARQVNSQELNHYDGPSTSQTIDADAEKTTTTNDPAEEVRNREDFPEEIEHPTPTRPQVKLPGYWESIDVTTIEGRGEGGLEDGEIDDAAQLDGTDLGDVELEDLLELEEDGADVEDLYEGLDQAIPESFASSSSNETAEPPPKRPSLNRAFHLNSTAYPVPAFPPGLPLSDPYVKRVDTWITAGECALYQHPLLHKYRAGLSTTMGALDANKDGYADRDCHPDDVCQKEYFRADVCVVDLDENGLADGV
ncbi:uncharacterized protein LY89DRAFT_676825 [Mollisia scopiformis]|uniref:Uncharacterized protein n=1 Tax=Mollisia scopiformis TaxID=149040 RepID=A0A132B7N2_MOLSC|nr:uncharacterized protein LY89DRAFT_676825 [Mollisia scopiformis]KUJ08405.1 hypothetical protein LY89DRAFT_676825 [Mollisia scopiformis]